jgi:hypothetical protein
MGRQEGLVLRTQTGRRKSDRLSTLAGGRPGSDENARQAQETDEPKRGTAGDAHGGISLTCD